MLLKQKMLNERIYEVLHTNVNDKRHSKLMSKSLGIGEKIKSLIPADKLQEYRVLEDQLYDIENQANNIVLVKTYKQGFTDGLEIALLLLKQKR